MRIVSIASMELQPAHTNWRGNPEPAQLVLLDDERDVVASIELSKLAAALAPYLAIAQTKEPS